MGFLGFVGFNPKIPPSQPHFYGAKRILFFPRIRLTAIPNPKCEPINETINPRLTSRGEWDILFLVKTRWSLRTPPVFRSQVDAKESPLAIFELSKRRKCTVRREDALVTRCLFERLGFRVQNPVPRTRIKFLKDFISGDGNVRKAKNRILCDHF